MRNILIESLGVYLPERVVSTQEVMDSCENVIQCPLENLTGIKSRRKAGEKEFSIDLARHSISMCLEHSKRRPADIDLLISCNISRYDKTSSVTFEPSTAVQLKGEFGFNKALCFDISNACAGMFTGIHIVDGFIKSGLAKRALVVSGEYITHLTDTAQKELTDDREDLRLACLTLGDSGAAIILEESSNPEVGLHNIEMLTLGNYSDLCVCQPTTQAHGGYIMTTHSAKLKQIALQETAKLMIRKIQSGAQQYAINHFLMHQTAQSAIEQFGEYINQLLGKDLFNSQNTIINLKHRGNTSSTTHFVALWDKIKDSTIKSKDTVYFGVQASGITLGLAEYTFDDLPDRIRNLDRQEKLDGGGISDGAKQNEMRISISALGTTLHAGDAHADSIALATSAVRSCLKEAKCAPKEVGLLVNTGVYRNNFIYEPAMASIIAGENKLNATVNDWGDATTFAYDLGNGASGFLHACRNVQAMIGSGKTEKALCVSSEIDNNKARAPKNIMGLKESGCATLLEKSNGKGFIRFLFKHYPEYQDAFQSEALVENGQPFLKISRDANLEKYILQALPEAINELLNLEKLTMDDIRVVIPPQISGGFVRMFTTQLSLPHSKIVNLNDDQNYYTCSTVFGLKQAIDNGMVHEGDLGIILEAGSGLLIAAALYQF